YNYDVVVIGGGPAGLAAALAASKKGASVAVIERNDELGGILNQCIHSGFGLHYFKEELTGPEYAERFINEVQSAPIDSYLNAMVLSVTPEREITAMTGEGILTFKAGAIVMAMGCRERTRGAIKIPGTRPAGVFTAGIAQRYVNLENLKPGNRVVILGSGDIGLIMARRLTLEGITVEGVYEIMPYANGLTRNIINCLNDFDIPLHLSTTVTRINGINRVESVDVAKVDSQRNPIPGTERNIPCDTLLLSVGLIPENELSIKAGVTLSPVTGGAVVDDTLETSVPGIFACGNALHVHDVVDNVTTEAQDAGSNAADFAAGQRTASPVTQPVTAEGPVRYTVPSTLEPDRKTPVTLKFRVGAPIANGITQVTCGGKVIRKGSKARSYVPSIMETVRLTPKDLAQCSGPVSVTVVEQ
ncbi:MAG: FAD-dependent oxidoreductase, partial [Eubacteriaceae bacterium]|nr:FAD-dependent oxidoreductase [Eubacteriaceae bacterium]